MTTEEIIKEEIYQEIGDTQKETERTKLKKRIEIYIGCMIFGAVFTIIAFLIANSYDEKFFKTAEYYIPGIILGALIVALLIALIIDSVLTRHKLLFDSYEYGKTHYNEILIELKKQQGVPLREAMHTVYFVMYAIDNVSSVSILSRNVDEEITNPYRTSVRRYVTLTFGITLNDGTQVKEKHSTNIEGEYRAICALLRFPLTINPHINLLYQNCGNEISILDAECPSCGVSLANNDVK